MNHPFYRFEDLPDYLITDELRQRLRYDTKAHEIANIQGFSHLSSGSKNLLWKEANDWHKQQRYY